MKIIRSMILFMLLSGCNLMTVENTQTITTLQEVEEISLSITQTPPVGQIAPSAPIKQTEIASLATQGISQPTPIPYDQSAPWFSPLIGFAVEPDRALARQMFPCGTKQIYAMWEYGNMSPGLTIRREWYRDGQLWLEKEEMWDMEKYGRYGMVLDVSVYDFENGLEPGSYLLKLFIDGREFLSDGYMSQTFVIRAPEVIEAVLSPDGMNTASVDAAGGLLVRSADGFQRTVTNDPGITSLTWHPDSVHLFYSSNSSSSTPPSPIGFWSELWAVNIQTGEQWQLGGAEEDLHDPVISPGGQYLALTSGSGFMDACFVDKRLVFLQLDSGLKRVRLIELADFAGLETDFEDTGMPTSVYPVGVPTWQSNNALEVELNWTCTADSPNGIYRLDLESLEAVRIE